MSDNKVYKTHGMYPDRYDDIRIKKETRVEYLMLIILIVTVLIMIGCMCYSMYSRAGDDNDIYSVEIYDDGKVEVTTDQRYINQIDEHTFIITDKDFDEVEKALMDMQDLGGE